MKHNMAKMDQRKRIWMGIHTGTGHGSGVRLGSEISFVARA